VACSGDYLSINARMEVVNLQTKTVIFSQPLSIPITNVAIDSDDMAYLSTYSSGVMIFDLSQRVFVRDENNPLPGGPGVAFDAQDWVYICDFAQDSIYVYNQFQQRLGAYLVGDGPLSIDIYDPSFNTLTINKRIPLADFFLYPNYPNPFNPETTIIFEISRFSPIELEIFNILGQSVRTLINQHFSTGFYQLSWDGKNWMGVEVPAGIYFCRLKCGSQLQYRKLEVIR
jgi:hypothetical protein